MLRALKRLIHGDDKLWLAAAKIFVGNGNGDASAVAPCGDLTVDSAGSFAIGASKITAAKLAYTAVSITVVASAASTTSCYAVLAITSGAKLLGIWLTTEVSDAASFTWACNQGTNSIKIDITEGQALNTLVWKGVVIEP
jgi:hypothetical protein